MMIVRTLPIVQRRKRTQKGQCPFYFFNRLVLGRNILLQIALRSNE